MITAPFNFVPLNEKVFFPPWAEDVSHDVPFEDGESGVIDITITAKSPIFIRDHEDEKEFCNYNGEYYIPATSVKGMVRNVLEIMSFSKMSLESFDDNTYAVRDLSSAKNFYMKEMQKGVSCGWLKKSNDGFIIEDCGVAGRIRHEEIDKALKIDFASKFKKDGFEKTSEYKYNILGDINQSITVGDMYKSTTNAKYDKREFYKYKKDGQRAILVVTGQPTPRKDTGKMGDGKGFEFLFFESKRELKVDTKVFENFKFAYFDGRKTEPKESSDWKFWKEKLENGEKIPVFFQKDGNKITHFGLSYLYKLPYKHSTKDGIPKTHEDARVDLAQTIFGYISKDEKTSLKGRVQFSHFKAVKNVKSLKQRTEVLGTPRASYYPIYVKQEGELFSTFMDNDFEIAGRKRYPIHKGNFVQKTEDTGNENIGTTFKPLQDGVLFNGKLRYHNLKKVELGAILSALTFHNTPNTYHNIGMAKSLGYGKIELKLDGIKDVQEYLKEFELLVSAEIDEWSDSKQLKELVTMATPQTNQGNSQLKYMKLDDFANNKSKTKDYLRNYSQLNNIKSVKISTLISKADLDKLREKNELLEKERIAKAIEKEKQQKFNLELEDVKQTQNIQIIDNFIKKYPDCEPIDMIIDKLNNLKKEQENNKDNEVNKKFDSAYKALENKKSKPKQYQKELDKFITKWNKKQNHKNSKYILEFLKDLV